MYKPELNYHILEEENLFASCFSQISAFKTLTFIKRDSCKNRCSSVRPITRHLSLTDSFKLKTESMHDQVMVSFSTCCTTVCPPTWWKLVLP